MSNIDSQLDAAARSLAVDIPASATLAQRLDAILAVAIDVVTPATPDQFNKLFGLIR